ncbi:hypothetical protein [Natronomonas sp.]|uniref:hypothetical protein n=1 Tax=Natronomonas sp. TaxID=2184060 RepID=UPI003976871A
MDTESAGDAELSVALPPSLCEWLDERAAALGIEREALLVQLLETHRTAAEFDEEGSRSLFESVESGDRLVFDGIDVRFEETDDRIDEVAARTTDIDGRVNELDAKLTNNVEDLRERVIQLRDAIEERAPADHSHAEFETLSDRIETLSDEFVTARAEVAEVKASLEAVEAEISPVDGRLETAEEKLDRLARALVARKRHTEANAAADAELNELQQAANRRGTATADCGGCGESVRIGLLSTPTCPHCDRRLCGLDESNSLFGLFASPTLAVGSGTRESADE